MDRKAQNETAHLHNESGVIAEKYTQLQATHALDAAREAYPLPRASNLSSIRAIFQSAEVALLNIADLMSLATVKIKERQFGKAATKMSWVHAFHRVLIGLSEMPIKLGLVQNFDDVYGELRISDSPAFKTYAEVLRKFDREVSECIKSGDLPVELLLIRETLDNNQLRFIHLTRVCNHETTMWENNLSVIPVPAMVPSYDEFVVSQAIHDAVYDTTLEGDTYYTPFRGLHQIPEILSAEINDRIEMSILQIRTGALDQAYEHLRYSNTLSEGILASLSPIVDNLSNSEYYTIRENLGPTSGSHSVNIHYHMFRDLYGQLWDEFAKYLLNEQTKPYREQDIQKAIHQAELQRFENQRAFLTILLVNELLKLRMFINEWRSEHLHLPRNNVGGGRTKSLAGSPDAIESAKKMRDGAIIKDPMRPLVEAGSLKGLPKDSESTPLTSYFDTQISLDSTILEITGKITRERFKHVQERTGVFAKKSSFTPPPKRKV